MDASLLLPPTSIPATGPPGWPEAGARPRQDASASAESSGPRRALLVIDDEDDIRAVVAAVLETRGIEVFGAGRGPEGIALFEQHADRIGAVLLDANLPGMNGEAVCRALRAVDPGVRVLLSSGIGAEELAARFADVPLAGIVEKPYTAAVLVHAVRAALAEEPAAPPRPAVP